VLIGFLGSAAWLAQMAPPACLPANASCPCSQHPASAVLDSCLMTCLPARARRPNNPCHHAALDACATPIVSNYVTCAARGTLCACYHVLAYCSVGVRVWCQGKPCTYRVLRQRCMAGSNSTSGVSALSMLRAHAHSSILPLVCKPGLETSLTARARRRDAAKHQPLASTRTAALGRVNTPLVSHVLLGTHCVRASVC
jgi:hypothetical protein